MAVAIFSYFLGTETGYLLLPFLLVLAIVYGSLEFGGVFKNNTVKFLIALVIGFFAVSSAEVVEFTYSILPYAAILFVVFFFLGFLRSFFKGKKGGKRDYPLLMACAALLLIFFASYEEILPGIEGDVITLVALLFIILLFYMAYKSGASEK